MTIKGGSTTRDDESDSDAIASPADSPQALPVPAAAPAPAAQRAPAPIAQNASTNTTLARNLQPR
jgi:hypothetical protein